jgi:hypothetical protein
MVWAAVGVAAVGAYSSYSSAQDAQAAGQAANQQNIQFQQQANQQRDPFSTGGSRAQYVPQLNDLMAGGYSGIQNDPMFQAREKQAMEATQRKMSSQGQGMGTNDLLALQQQSYLQQGDFFNEQYTRLSALSGASQGGGGVNTVQGMSPQVAGGIAAAPGQALGEGLGAIYGAYKNNVQPSSSPGQEPNGFLGTSTGTTGQGQAFALNANGSQYGAT